MRIHLTYTQLGFLCVLRRDVMYHSQFIIVVTILAPILMSFIQLLEGVGFGSPFLSSLQEAENKLDSTQGSRASVRLQLDNGLVWFQLVLSPDGKLAALRRARNSKAFGHPNRDYGIAIFDLCQGKLIRNLERNGDDALRCPTSILFSPDGNQVAVGYMNDWVLLWGLKSGRSFPLEQAGPKEPRLARHPFMFSHDGKYLIMPNTIWDPVTGKIVRYFKYRETYGHLTACSLAEDNHLLIAEHQKYIPGIQGEDRTNSFSIRWTIRVWDYMKDKDLAGLGPTTETHHISDGRQVTPYPEDGMMLRKVGILTHGLRIRVAPSGKAIPFPRLPKGALEVTHGRDNSLVLLDGVTGKELHRVTECMQGKLYAYALSEDNNRLVALTQLERKAELLVWDVSSFRKQAASEQPDLPDKEWVVLWEKLADADLFQAFRAMRRLAASPKQTLALFKVRLQPAPMDKINFDDLLINLDSDNFRARQQAEVVLLRGGDEAIPILEKALQGRLSLEAHRRTQAILQQLRQAWLPDPDTRRLLWSIELLEDLGTPEAKHLLERLAQGAPRAWATREAQTSLLRLKKTN